MTNKIKNIVLFVVVLIVSLSNVYWTEASDSEDPLDLQTEFIEAELKLIDFDDKTTWFEIPQNKKIIGIRNDLHIRLESDFARSIHKVLAPMTAVSYSDREFVPISLIKVYKLSHYRDLAKQDELLFSKKISDEDLDNYLELHYSQNRFFEKETLDDFFGYSKDDWIDDYKSSSTSKSFKVEKEHDDNYIKISVFSETNIPMYITEATFENKSRLTNKITLTQFYPENILVDSQKFFFEHKLHLSSYKVPKSTYKIYSECKKTENVYILTYVINRE